MNRDSCGHHAGLGFCADCANSVREALSRHAQIIVDNVELLRRAADIFQSAGNYSLAQQIRMALPR